MIAGLVLKRMQCEVSRSFSELVYVVEILQQLLFKGHPGGHENTMCMMTDDRIKTTTILKRGNLPRRLTYVPSMLTSPTKGIQFDRAHDRSGDYRYFGDDCHSQFFAISGQGETDRGEN